MGQGDCIPQQPCRRVRRSISFRRTAIGSAVYILTMPDLDDKHQNFRVIDLVDDAAGSKAQTIEIQR